MRHLKYLGTGLAILGGIVAFIGVLMLIPWLIYHYSYIGIPLGVVILAYWLGYISREIQKDMP